MNQLSKADALAYFGLGDDEAELRRIVLEHDIDVEVDDEGSIVAIDADDTKEALFAEHERQVGYRPDDPKFIEAEQRKAERREAEHKRKRKLRRALLHERHEKERDATEPKHHPAS